MSDNAWCPTCGKFMMYPDSHRCPPKFIVWDPEDGEMAEVGHEVRAADHESAAEEWADQTDCERSYCILNGNDVVVHVVLLGEPAETAKRFRVSGESVPQYHAEEEPA